MAYILLMTDNDELGSNRHGQGVPTGVWGQLDDPCHGAHWLPCGRQFCYQVWSEYPSHCFKFCIGGELRIVGARTEARKVTFS